ncbi:spinocerebellar ataxia type 10 protein domain-containing protein, partial [Tribonema minus]
AEPRPPPPPPRSAADGGGGDGGVPHGRKADLVKVIANACHCCRAAQDRVRGAGGVPLVLSHCNIDHASPFLREWGIVAVRNLCEGNAENQACVAKLEKQGEAAATGSAQQHAAASDATRVNRYTGRLEAVGEDEAALNPK